MKRWIEVVLEQLSIQQIRRIKSTDKEFIEFHVSVFNTGSVVSIKCTNICNTNLGKDGLSFVLESTDANNCLLQLEK